MINEQSHMKCEFCNKPMQELFYCPDHPPKQSPPLVPLDVMAMRECGQEAVRKELFQTHSWKLIRIVCEAIYEKFGVPESGLVALDEEKLHTIWHLENWDGMNAKVAKFIKDICNKFGVTEIGLVPLDEKKLAKFIAEERYASVGVVAEPCDHDLSEAICCRFGTSSPLTCSHANEVPSVCKCPGNCYCKSNTCAPSPALTLEDIKECIKGKWSDETIALAISNRLKGEK